MKKETRGRKPKPNKKTRQITIKVTDAELDAIRRNAEAERLTVSGFLVRRGLKITG